MNLSELKQRLHHAAEQLKQRMAVLKQTKPQSESQPEQTASAKSQPQPRAVAPKEELPPWKQKLRQATVTVKLFFHHCRQWLRLHLRRWAFLFHAAAGGTRAVGPISFLLVSGALGVAFTLTTLYSTSYAVTVDGTMVGIIEDQSILENAIAAVETQGSELLGTDYKVDSEIDCSFTLTLKSNLCEQRVLENYFYSQLDQVSSDLRKYEVLVNGRSMGVVKDEQALNHMLEGLQEQYVNENTIDAGFVETLDIETVYVADKLSTVAEIQEKLQEKTTGETTYTVQKGDTFNAIAYANDMSVSDLKALNPDFNINRLMIGDVLNVKEIIPFLSVQTVEEVTYLEPIECPVETVESDSIYVGSSKIVTQGVEGEAEVHATVTYVNGKESEREVISSKTLREPTVTVKAIGTKPRPKTASYGSYIWPCYGRITSYFGGRNIFGSYSYHSGIDISQSYGASIVAADGGTVTFSGWKGTYGNLVIITHDNGTKTYYAHNSSLLVSAGQKVYRGQPIARAGSTGRSTGVHCHFEVRVNGTAVNPLNFLN